MGDVPKASPVFLEEHMKLGIVCAMDVEAALLKEELEDVRIEHVGMLEIWGGRLRGLECGLVRSGVGKVFSAMATQALIDAVAPDAIVNSGIAGGLDPSLAIGDFVIATDCVQYDFDTSPWGYEPGFLSGINRLGFESDAGLRAKLAEAVRRFDPDARIREGRVASGDRFVTEDALKDWIVRTFGALCCEMESAPIAQVSWANGLPFGILRAISDMADESALAVSDENERRISELSARPVLELAELLA